MINKIKCDQENDGPQLEIIKQEIVELVILPQVINLQNCDQWINGQENDGPHIDNQEVVHPQMINPWNGDQGIDRQENDGPQNESRDD